MPRFSFNIETGVIRKLPEIITNISNTHVSMSEIKKLNITNLRLLGRDCLCGPTLQGRPVKDFLMLRNMGIRSIVDFREDAPKKYASYCRSKGFSYFKFPLDSIENVNNTQFYSKTGRQSYSTKPLLIIMLRKFFDTMRKGHAYIGCQYGIDRTNKGLTLNYFLSSDKTAPRLLHWEDETQKAVVNRNVRIVEKIFHHMTPAQKETLGLPSSFRDILSRKMGNFIIENKP